MSSAAERVGEAPAAAQEADGKLDCTSAINARHPIERCRRRLAEGSLARRLYDRFFLPLDPPSEFTEPERELAERLMPRTLSGEPDLERCGEVLAEALAIYARPEERVDSAERRATTLQGAITIAASFLLAGAAFLADPGKVRGEGWRISLAAVLLTVIVCLLLAGFRALAATSRIHVFRRPTVSSPAQ
jgi:hypothetical protein